MRRNFKAAGWSRTLIAMGLALTICRSSDAQTPTSTPPSHPIAAIWPNGPLEVRIALAAPISSAQAQTLVDRKIEFGSGDDSGSLRIAGVILHPTGRLLTLNVDPHPKTATPYRINAAGFKAQYALNGAEASWFEPKPKNDADEQADPPTPLRTLWLPELDPSAIANLASSSVEHAEAKNAFRKPSRFVVRSLITFPAGPAKLTLTSDAPFQATFGFEPPRDAKPANANGQPLQWSADVEAESLGDVIELVVSWDATANPPRLRVIDAKDGRAISRDRQIPPWAPIAPAATAMVAQPPYPLEGGDAVRGRALFFGEQAKCSACHQIKGQGGKIGPPLDALADRDRTWIYQQIAEPSARIAPDYAASTVALQDGRVLVGVVRAEGTDQIRVFDAEAKAVAVRKSEITDFRPSSSSVMPSGLTGAIGEAAVRDLLSFLKKSGG